MCGIVGEAFFDVDATNNQWVQQASRRMQHRGPDGEGIYCSAGVALGHRRLAILDLTRGAQPMSYANERYWITFNGEIYNYRALRAELKAHGCDSFATDSDTEVILAAFATWGPASFVKLNGIFAFGIWDCLKQELIIARDHLGVKPLFYHHDEAGFRFSSELKGLLAHPRVKRAVDYCALTDYLTMGYVLSPHTIINGVYKLAPGNYVRVQNGDISVVPYWNLAEYVGSDAHKPYSEADSIARFADAVKTTVEDQMISDVPVGAFLSGGIDTTSIVSYAKEHTNSVFKTFSIGFEDASYDELGYAQQVADHVGTEHHTQIVKAPTFDQLAKLIWYYDEPIGDTSIIPTYFVAKLAREQVTVSLSGDGGDEILAGYDTYIADRFQRLYARVPSWLHHKVILPGTTLIPSSYKKVSLDFKIKQFIANGYGSAAQAHFGWRRMFSDHEIQTLFAAPQAADGYSPFEQYACHYKDVAGASPLQQSLYVDVKTWLLDDILPKVDRASMACGLEARVPFLAPRFVEAMFALPDTLKLHGMTRKYILKQAMRSRLPATVIHRKKRGFNAPVSHWMRTEWHDSIQDLFRQRNSKLIDLGNETLQSIWSRHCSGREDHGFKLWTLLSLLLWEQEVLTAPSLPS